MQNTYSLLRSRTFWTLVVLSILPIVNAIVPTLPTGAQNIVIAILGVAAAYFHNDGMVKANATN